MPAEYIAAQIVETSVELSSIFDHSEYKQFC